MNSELEAFRAQLRAAGQPYSHWGAQVLGLGLLLLVAAQVIFIVRPSLSLVGLGLAALSVVIMSVGWVMLLIAFLRRRRWAKAQALVSPPLPPIG